MLNKNLDGLALKKEYEYLDVRASSSLFSQSLYESFGTSCTPTSEYSNPPHTFLEVSSPHINFSVDHLDKVLGSLPLIQYCFSVLYGTLWLISALFRTKREGI